MVSALLWPLLAVNAHAQGPDAAALERGARQAYERHAYAAAARGFEAAYRAAPYPATKFNAALAWDQAGDPARAADAYEAALGSGGLAPEQAQAAEARLSKLNQELGIAVLQGPAGAVVWIDGDVEAKLPARMHLTPGDHVASITGQGAPTEPIRFAVRAGASTAVAFADPREAKAKPTVVAPAPPAAPVAPETSAARTWAWVSLGGAVAFTGAAAALGFATLGARDYYVNERPSDPAARDRALTLRALTNVAWGLAAASGVVGVGLMIASRSSPAASAPKAARAELLLLPGGAALRLAF